MIEKDLGTTKLVPVKSKLFLFNDNSWSSHITGCNLSERRSVVGFIDEFTGYANTQVMLVKSNGTTTRSRPMAISTYRANKIKMIPYHENEAMCFVCNPENGQVQISVVDYREDGLHVTQSTLLHQLVTDKVENVDFFRIGTNKFGCIEYDSHKRQFIVTTYLIDFTLRSIKRLLQADGQLNQDGEVVRIYSEPISDDEIIIGVSFSDKTYALIGTRGWSSLIMSEVSSNPGYYIIPLHEEMNNTQLIDVIGSYYRNGNNAITTMHRSDDTKGLVYVSRLTGGENRPFIGSELSVHHNHSDEIELLRSIALSPAKTIHFFTNDKYTNEAHVVYKASVKNRNGEKGNKQASLIIKLLNNYRILDIGFIQHSDDTFIAIMSVLVNGPTRIDTTSKSQPQTIFTTIRLLPSTPSLIDDTEEPMLIQ